MDYMQALPDDAIAAILRRLEPRDLAASRCVRKAWHDVIDAHRLLLPHVLPSTVHGLFVNYIDHGRPHFLARPSAQPMFDGNLSFLPDHRRGINEMVDHCNGILLYRCCLTLYVVNPATRRWDALSCEYGYSDEYLVFDPVASPHYEVFSIPRVPEKVVRRKSESERLLGKFSVTANREIKRFSLLDCKYQVINAPVDTTKDAMYLGKSEKGIYLATEHIEYQLQVWTLNESSGQMEWVLKYHIDLEPWKMIWLRRLKGFDKTWTLGDDDADANDDDGYDDYDYDDDDENENEEEEDDDEDEDEEENEHENEEEDTMSFLGFHPYKEVVFLALSIFGGVAYHLKSSKIQYLGDLRPKDYYQAHSNGLYEAFPYTPCLLGELLEHTSETHRRN
ncbi:hypothetical protein ACQ4PT_070955 [Festuca glaucescens]